MYSLKIMHFIKKKIPCLKIQNSKKQKMTSYAGTCDFSSVPCIKAES